MMKGKLQCQQSKAPFTTAHGVSAGFESMALTIFYPLAFGRRNRDFSANGRGFSTSLGCCMVA